MSCLRVAEFVVSKRIIASKEANGPVCVSKTWLLVPRPCKHRKCIVEAELELVYLDDRLRAGRTSAVIIILMLDAAADSRTCL